jgi:hypothetical protein
MDGTNAPVPPSQVFHSLTRWPLLCLDKVRLKRLTFERRPLIGRPEKVHKAGHDVSAPPFHGPHVRADLIRLGPIVVVHK